MYRLGQLELGLRGKLGRLGLSLRAKLGWSLKFVVTYVAQVHQCTGSLVLSSGWIGGWLLINDKQSRRLLKTQLLLDQQKTREKVANIQALSIIQCVLVYLFQSGIRLLRPIGVFPAPCIILPKLTHPFHPAHVCCDDLSFLQTYAQPLCLPFSLLRHL